MSIYKIKCGEGKLRVISGSARGKKLLCSEGLSVRPTLDRVKESVFNMIAFDLPDARVLDLFCGSGALGIEALSRGSAHAVFVDNNPVSMEYTKKNLIGTRLLDAATLVLSDSISYLSDTAQIFDIIFIDPPYKAQLYEPVINTMIDRGLLAPGGTLVIESALDDVPKIPQGVFSSVREKKYGKVKILIIKA